MMMAFLRSSLSRSSNIHHGISTMSCRAAVSFYSTETQNNVMSNNKITENLYKRISPVGDPNVSMYPLLEQWENEGKSIHFSQLVVIVKSLRKFKRYTHALQISEWISTKYPKLQPAGAAVHLDLVSRVEGLEQAEKYFDSLPDDVKTLHVYGALLNCYATTKSVEKAEATAEKMKRMGMMTTLSYNSMLNLYKKTGDMEKLEKVYQEMLEMGVSCDKPTFYIRLSAYAAASDLEGMERGLQKLEESLGLNVDWNAYIIASTGYDNSGLPDKSYEMLKKSENYISGNSKGAAWEILLRKYASLGKKEDVYRIWDLYKTSWTKVYNRGYSAMVYALIKLDDIDGAEKVLAEWETQKLSYDFRLPNMLITAYCTKGLFAKAEAYVDRVVDMGKKPPASTWVLFVTGYAKKNEMEKAVEMLKKCVLADDKRWCRLDQDTFDVCVEYLKGKGDLEMVEEIEKTFQDKLRVPQTSDADSLADKIDEESDEVEESRG